MNSHHLNLSPSDRDRDNSDIHIVVGMSGGVDSSVAAHLLKQAGYQVSGMFMKNWEEDDNSEYCHAARDLQDVQQVCDKLKIKLHTINFAAEYWDNVFEYFLKEYKADDKVEFLYPALTLLFLAPQMLIIKYPQRLPIDYFLIYTLLF